MTTASDTNQALKQDVAGLEKKRQILEQIVAITRAIESMQESLNAVLVMGVASKDLPEDALKLYSSLCGSMRNLPVNRIKAYYANLEILVKKQLNRVLNYSGIDFNDDDQVEFITLSSESHEQSPVELLDAFKRTAQTAVSLRVLLRKRGVQTPGSVLPANAKTLKQHLSHLEAHEQVQRRRIKEKIEEMKEDVTRMIDNPACPEGMKTMLRDVVGNLDQDLQLLQRGAPVDRLSFVAETEEIVGTDTGEMVVEEITVEEIPAVDAPDKGGFSETAIRWLNSPWDVSWDDAKEKA
jgi:DNA-binding FrmR family transcriptional regulator